jgi:ketosteroid isomerase-like protein
MSCPRSPRPPTTQWSLFRGGRIASVEDFTDRAEALRPAGLEGQAMSQQNVEIARRAIEAFNMGDLDTALRDVDPDAVVDWSRSQGVEAGIYRGREAVRDFWSTFLDTFDRIAVTSDEFIDSGDHVVVPNLVRVWGRDGVEAVARSVAVVTLRSGRIVRWSLYRDVTDALKAVGLEE